MNAKPAPNGSGAPVRVGICGLGTVGGGTFEVLTRNAGEIARRAGRAIEVVCVGARSEKPHLDLSRVRVEKDIFALADDPEVEVLVELIGGYDTARELVLRAIDNGKHIVTANKALIAVHGNEIFGRAHERGVMVGFEASVAGGIPIIKAIREGLSANRIEWIAGIINGTGNFILSEMRDKQRDFVEVLAEAQELGYAEADPTFDVEGIDAAHKLTILASIAFGIPLQFDRTYTEGISAISQLDVQYAEELGYRIKHLGITRRTETGVQLRVHPTLIPEHCLIANVHGVMNAVLVHCDTVGSTLYYGPGAGAQPTASAVVADIVDVARNADVPRERRVPHLAFHPGMLSDTPVSGIDEVSCGYYLRMQVEDRTGVLARISSVLAERGINIEGIIQKDGPAAEADSGWVPVVLMTGVVSETDMNGAIQALEALPEVAGQIVRIRVEHLDAI